MKRLGQLLSTSAFHEQDQTTIVAAAVVGAANKALQEICQLTPDQAQAISFRQNKITVRVSHGSVAGKIMIAQNKLLQEINRAVKILYPHRAPAIERLFTRQG